MNFLRVHYWSAAQRVKLLSLARLNRLRRSLRNSTSWQDRLCRTQKSLLDKHVQSPYVQRLVPASDDGAILLNTVVVNNGGNDQGEPLVLTHGYGSGLGFWATVLDALATATSRPIIAVDWNGMGASSRTPFTKYRHGGADANEAAANAESYFIEPFERWRQEMGIEKMALCGHSLGGFLSAAYATKHPDRVSNLIMVSPAGLLSQPDGSRLPADTLTFQQKLLALGWANNITPQSIVRAVGPWGHRLTDRMVRARFHAMKEDDLEVLSAYLYGITSAPPGGEFSLNAILVPVMTGPERGVYARNPIGERLIRHLPDSIPLTIMFGDVDWMYNWKIQGIPLVQTGRTRLVRIPNSGHHIHLDNSPEFVSQVRWALSDGHQWR
ncbi:hypothetical protein PBRA_005944 [Plasmodiophora brassicae]|nr:hypothetical protein PBRA_005944 [Plasmodiophora brassicae]